MGVSIPLFYQGQGQVDAAEAEQRAAKHRHAATATRVRAAARSTAARLRAARESAAFYKSTLLPLREKIVDQTLLQYNAMNSGPLQLLGAKRDQVDTAVAYVDALREYWTARADAESLLAGRARAATSVRVTAPSGRGRARDGH